MAARKLTPLPWTTLLGAFALGAVLAWLVVAVLGAAGHRLPPPGWILAAGLGVGALAAFAGAWFAHQRFHVLRRYPDPARSLALVAIARASALAGAGLAGAYLFIALTNLPSWAIPAARQRVVGGLATAIAAAVLAVAGKVLERECRSEHPGSDDEPPAD
jgi:hypothetical protein